MYSLYSSTAHSDPVSSPLHSPSPSCFLLYQIMSAVSLPVELCCACYCCETSLSVSSDCVSLLNICWLDICKNNKVTKHELLNLQLLFTLIIFLAWGGRYILQEACELLAYLLWDFALNLSQACFNFLEVHQKSAQPLQGHFCVPYYEFFTPLYGALSAPH